METITLLTMVNIVSMVKQKLGCAKQANYLVNKTYLSTSSLIYPSLQDGPTIFHKGNFLKHTPFQKI